MLLGRAAQLFGAVAQAALAEQVQMAAASLENPVHTGRAVHEAQHLDAVQTASQRGPARDALHGLQLSIRHARTGHLNAIHIDVLQQGASNHEFLMRHEAYSARLLAVAQRGIHYLNPSSFHSYCSLCLNS